MNTYLLTSGILTIVLCVAHSVIGEMSIINPIQKIEVLPAVRGSIRMTKRTLRFAWHVTSVLGLGVATILIYYSRFTILDPDQAFVVKVLSLTFFLSFIVSLIGSRAKHPAWIVFLISSLLTWLN
jgi:hypothetical protein